MAAQNRNRKVKRLALMGLLFALAMALSFLESLLPALPMLPPGGCIDDIIVDISAM